MSLTTTILFAALAPNRSLNERCELDWGASLLTGAARRSVHRLWEYQGSNIPEGAPPISYAGFRGTTTRESRA